MKSILSKKSVLVLTFSLLASTAMATNNKRLLELTDVEQVTKKLCSKERYYIKPLKKMIDLANNGDSKAQHTIIKYIQEGKYEIDEIQRESKNIEISKWFEGENKVFFGEESQDFFTFLIAANQPLNLSFIGLLEKAAEEGDAKAQFNVSLMYRIANGKDKNPEQSLQWLKKSADQGYALAQFELAYYYNSIGDMRQTIDYYRKAAAQGYLDANHSMGDILTDENLNNEVRAIFGEDPGFSLEAYDWFKTAADLGDVKSHFRCGDEKYNQKDYKKALKWFTRAGSQGNATSCYFIASMYRGARGVSQDFSKAIYHYITAISLRNNVEGEESEKLEDLEELGEFFPFDPRETIIAGDDEDKYKEPLIKEIGDFKINHAEAAQKWRATAEENNPNSAFRQNMVQVPYRFQPYDELAKLCMDFAIIADYFLKPGFMITCFNPKQTVLTALLQEETDSDQNRFVKAYAYKDKIYFAMGEDNVKKANQLIQWLNNTDSMWSEDLVKTNKVEDRVLMDLMVEQRKLQLKSKNLDQKTEDQKSKIKTKNQTLNEQVEEQKKILQYFKEAKMIPQQLESLLVDDTAIRHRIFLMRYPYFKDEAVNSPRL